MGADNNEFLKQLIDVKGFRGAAVTNPATIGGVGAAVAIKVLGGGTVPEVDEADARGVGQDGDRLEDDQVELLAEAAADVQLAAVHEAVDDLHAAQLTSCKGP